MISMTSSRKNPGTQDTWPPRPPPPTHSCSERDLLAEGWFVADEPRLSEAVEIYEEMGLEVALLPVSPEHEECTECIKQDPDRYRVIYTRKRDEA